MPSPDFGNSASPYDQLAHYRPNYRPVQQHKALQNRPDLQEPRSQRQFSRSSKTMRLPPEEEAKRLRHVDLYTDGACDPNPGVGACVAKLVCKLSTGQDHVKVVTSKYSRTTNNRMELLAIIQGLQALKKRTAVTVFSDSKYVVDSMTNKWVRNWRDNEWYNSRGLPTPNTDLWIQLLILCGRHLVLFQWVKGKQKNHPQDECHHLAEAALADTKLPVQRDVNYEEGSWHPDAQNEDLTQIELDFYGEQRIVSFRGEEIDICD